jgi:hypothetical protein
VSERAETGGPRDKLVLARVTEDEKRHVHEAAETARKASVSDYIRSSLGLEEEGTVLRFVELADRSFDGLAVQAPDGTEVWRTWALEPHPPRTVAWAGELYDLELESARYRRRADGEAA